MYYFNLRGLINHLANEQNTEKESFLYSFYNIILLSLPIEEALGAETTKGLGIWAIPLFLISILFCYLVLKSYYTSNGGDNGKHFLHRTLALSFVLMLRIAIVMIPFLGLILAASSQSSLIIEGISPLTSSYFMLAIGIIFFIGIIGSIVYYISTMNRALKTIAQHDCRQSATT